MVFTDRQLKLVQAGAGVLQNELFLTIDKSILIINQAISAEQEKQNKSMDDVDQEDAAIRKRFIRGVVVRVRKKLINNSGASDIRINNAIEKFVKKIEEIWNQ